MDHKSSLRLTGYTLIELAVVLAIMAVIAIIAYVGLSSSDKGEKLVDAQNVLISRLRTVQNQVESGLDAGTTPIKTAVFNPANKTQYIINGQIYDLPEGVTMTALSHPVLLCFGNPNLSTFGSGCSDVCTCNSFACVDTGTGTCANSPSRVIITLSGSGSPSKQVAIEGSGLFINRIYVP